MDDYVMILGTLVGGIIIILGALWFVTKKSAKPGGGNNEATNQPILPGARRRQPVFTRRGAGRSAPSASAQDDDEDDETPLDIQLPDGKVGAKKMAKLQAKAERKAHREAEQREREDRKQKQEKEDEERKKVDEREKAEEKKKEEEERKIREEIERKEHEEYLKMKQAFSVESEGFEEGAEEPENALQQFVSHIKNNKVVVVEELAATFGLKTAAALDRVKTLQNDGIITGVMDDRGKFIYISPEELRAVATFVRQRGRVSIAELVDNSNQLIDLSPNLTAQAATS